MDRCADLKFEAKPGSLSKLELANVAYLHLDGIQDKALQEMRREICHPIRRLDDFSMHVWVGFSVANWPNILEVKLRLVADDKGRPVLDDPSGQWLAEIMIQPKPLVAMICQRAKKAFDKACHPFRHEIMVAKAEIHRCVWVRPAWTGEPPPGPSVEFYAFGAAKAEDVTYAGCLTGEYPCRVYFRCGYEVFYEADRFATLGGLQPDFSHRQMLALARWVLAGNGLVHPLWGYAAFDQTAFNTDRKRGLKKEFA